MDHDKNYTYNPKECAKNLDFDFTRRLKFEKSSKDCEAILDGLSNINKILIKNLKVKYNYSTFLNTKDNLPEESPCGLKEDIVL